MNSNNYNNNNNQNKSSQIPTRVQQMQSSQNRQTQPQPPQLNQRLPQQQPQQQQQQQQLPINLQNYQQQQFGQQQQQQQHQYPQYQQQMQGMNMNAYSQYQSNVINQPLNNNPFNNYFPPQQSWQPNNFPFQGNTLPIQELQGEDQIKESVKNEKATNKIQYDLEKGLSLDIKTLQKHFQFNKNNDQVLPIMVSVKTLDQTSDMEIEQNLLEQRPNIDLICVIDNSGSMSGQKIYNVKQTLLQLIEMLNENDRLSLITFNSGAQQLCNLRKVDVNNKDKLKNVVNSISAGGGTNITSGIQIAFNILQNRKQQNPISSIFLLSDGQDQGADSGIRRLLSTSNAKLSDECFTIHSFGFGHDHDGPLMQKIAQIKDGSFYFVEKIEQVDEFFIDALGGLFSVVAQDINIQVKINRQDELFNKFFKNSTVQRTYGPMWKVVKQNEGYQIKINQLFSGVSKDFIFEINVPKSEVNELQDFERNVEFIKVQLTASPINNEYTTQIVKDSNLVLTLFTQNEKVAQDSEINDNVEFNYLRVKAAQAMQEAIQFADQNQFNQGQVILTDMLKKIENSHPNNRQKLQVIKEDLLQCQQSAQPKVYQQQGKFQMLQNCNNNFQQQSYANRSNDIFQNNCQRAMVQQQQVFKSNNQNNFS